jgi:hypothetical protein
VTVSRHPASLKAARFARTFLVAFVVVLLAAWAWSWIVGIFSVQPDYGAARPTPATLRGYALRYQIAGRAATELVVDDEGKSCDVLAASRELRDVCVLALNVDPAWIAAPAYGKLNTVDTPSYTAITWRAVLGGDPALCDRGGLLDARLAACRDAAAAGTTTSTEGSVTVEITRR